MRKTPAGRLLAWALCLALAMLPGMNGLAEESSSAIEAAPAEAYVPEVGEMELYVGDMAVAAAEDEATAQGDGATAEPTAAPETQVLPDPDALVEQPEPEPLQPILAQQKLTLGIKEKATLTLQDGSAPEAVGAVFTSSDAKIVKVSQAGVVTGKAVGKATVTVDVGGITSSCAVTVKKAPSKVKLSDAKLTMGVGETRKLKATLPKKTASAIRYSSSNKKVATVDAEGNVTALRKGKANITAKTFNGKKATCKVTVKAAPKSVSINPGVLTLWVDDTSTLKPVLSKNSAGSYSYAISDDTVASIKGDKITALAPGTAVITVTTYNGKTAEMHVEVSRKPVYRALLVGEVNFPGTGLGSLPAKKDVALMKSMLSSVKGAAKVKWKVTTRFNRTSLQLLSDIRSAFKGAQEGDVSLFYISTHGDQTLTMDGNYPEYAGCLNTYPDYNYSDWWDRNALTLGDLAECLAEVPGQVIVVIDSCGSGAAIYNSKGEDAPKSVAAGFVPADFDDAVVEAFERKDSAVLAPGVDQGAFVVYNKFFVLTASAYLETGWSAAGKYSYFTKWLTDGIGTSGKMKADSDGNKRTTLAELYKYIKGVADKKVFVYEGVRYKQHVQVYPSDSGFELFYRK